MRATRPRSYIDADFEVVSGPFRVGDEHPTQKGWFFTDKVGRHGEPLWYRPPGFISRWVYRIAATIAVVTVVGLSVLAILAP